MFEVVGELEGLSPESGRIADGSGMRGRADAGDEQRQDGRRVRPTLDHEVYDIAPESLQSGTELAYITSSVPTPLVLARV